MSLNIDPAFWQNKRVLLTGHTGFKGVWMALWLERLGAKVSGFSLKPDSAPNLFELLSPLQGIDSTIGDVRDAAAVQKIVQEANPEIVIHMAAQALVHRSYHEPVATMATNIIGTVNLLDALRSAKNLDVLLVVTSDKVYKNINAADPFCENAPLGGDDPYSASKAAQEIITHSWANSYFSDSSVAIATARAGNVIGGGDFSDDRLIPDIYRALAAKEKLKLRNPEATRPWQHVLDLNAGYLMYVERLSKERNKTPNSLNFGPKPGPSYTVGDISEKMIAALGQDLIVIKRSSKLKEKALLSVDATLAHKILGWSTKLGIDEAVRITADWYGGFLDGDDVKKITTRQLIMYESDILLGYKTG